MQDRRDLLIDRRQVLGRVRLEVQASRSGGELFERRPVDRRADADRECRDTSVQRISRDVRQAASRRIVCSIVCDDGSLPMVRLQAGVVDCLSNQFVRGR
jgi:hypothetical protein